MSLSSPDSLRHIYFPSKQGRTPHLVEEWAENKRCQAVGDRDGDNTGISRRETVQTCPRLPNNKLGIESDVRSVLERLLTDVLGYEPDQIDRETDFADFLLVYQGIKLAVIETKDWGAFNNEVVLTSALRQAANYADRHKAKYLFAFDAESMLLAERDSEKIRVKVTVRVDVEDPAEEIFHFTHYGLSKLPHNTEWEIDHGIEMTDPKLFKTHHGVKLPYTSFAYIGDLRDKKTWKLPYLLEDGKSVDTGRIDKAVSYLFSAGGYRGVQSKGTIPEASLTDVSKKLAKAYRQLGHWSKDDTLKSVQMLWQYLDARGETDLK